MKVKYITWKRPDNSERGKQTKKSLRGKRVSSRSKKLFAVHC